MRTKVPETRVINVYIISKIATTLKLFTDLFILKYFRFSRGTDNNHYVYKTGYLRSVTVTTLDSGILASEFELPSHDYVHFRTNSLGKGTNSTYLSQLWVK